VKPILGKAFEKDCRSIDATALSTIWQQSTLKGKPFPIIPEEFDWPRVGREYLKKVRRIIRETPELRSLLETELLEDIARNTTPLSPGFDIAKYRESLQYSYGHLKLYALDSTDRVDAIKLWNMFVEQTVRQALPPMRYELPLDVKRQLQEQGQLGPDLSPEALENYRQEYFRQPSQKALEAVADSQRAVILGDPGAGKSTLLQYLALDWVEGKTELLPLLIELREYAIAQTHNFLEFLHCGRGVNWQFDRQQLDFVHRTFLEYFCAVEIVNQFEKQRTLTFEQLRDEIFGQYWQDETWHEVLQLICGMIDAIFVGNIINLLMRQDVDRSQFLDTEKDMTYGDTRLKKEAINNLLLAAQCLMIVPNRIALENTERQLLYLLKQEIEVEHPDLFSNSAVKEIIRILAATWQGNTEVLTWLKSHLINLKKQESYFFIFIPIALLQGWKDDPETLLWIKKQIQQAE
jgi:tRNA A37 threonylcarbamoyladenosine biosynthesis protein TsaE